MILDNRGRVVWFLPLNTHGVTDFRVQRYRGQPVLTWWHGRPDKGSGDSGYSIYDDSYRLIAHVQAGNGWSGDIHEFKITPRNTALMTVSRHVHIKGREVLEGGVLELDIKTGRVLFDWHSINHVQLVESYYHLPKDPGRTYRLLPRQLDRDRPRRQSAGVRAQHAHDLQDQPAHGQDHLAARRQAQRLRARPGCDVRLAARRTPPAGRGPDAVRQFRRAAGPQAVPRTRPPPRHGPDARIRRAQLRPPAADRRRRPGQHAEARATGTTSSAGATSRTSPSSGRAGRFCSTDVSAAAASTPTGTTGSAGSDTLCSRPRSPLAKGTLYVSWNGATEVSQVAGARRRSKEHAATRPRRREDRIRNDGSRCPRRSAGWVAVRALDRRDRPLRRSTALRIG